MRFDKKYITYVKVCKQFEGFWQEKIQDTLVKIKLKYTQYIKNRNRRVRQSMITEAGAWKNGRKDSYKDYSLYSTRVWEGGNMIEMVAESRSSGFKSKKGL